MTSIQDLKEPKYWLLGIAVGLMAVNLTLMWRHAPVDVVGTSLLFWGAAAFLVWEKHQDLNLESDVISSILGTLLIGLVLLKSVNLGEYDLFLRISPFLSGVGLALLSSGWKRLAYYWQELFILGFIAISTGFLLQIFDISPFTAKFAAFVLWYMGFQVEQDGIYVNLPTGSIEVYSGCSGYSAILQLLGLAFLFLFMFPTNWKQKILVPLVAIVAGFAVNGVRVALMAFLVAYSSKTAFEYWHYGDGSLIFSMIGVVILGIFCWFFILRNEPESHNADKC